ncbi:L,D-transpeptidase family protein [Streptomyces polyrhachis]|uniref:L,D-transpeptidase family protein n=1 Tax=Streptomyces polyrhachis TaxID=1282885 RepID=A0ABW2GN93_9ACTN
MPAAAAGQSATGPGATGPGATPAAVAPATAKCTAGTGPYQREMERYLKRPADGHQSAADCEAIRAFQVRNKVAPATGYASLATYRMMLVEVARKNPNAAGNCPVRSYRVACVDLTRQIMWVQRGSAVVFSPVPVRTGKDDFETRLGWHTVYWRNRDHYSSIYDNAPMPYAQFFNGGQAFHGVYGDLFKGGSHGCVNLRYEDAARLWNVLREGDPVYVWGVKPGTNRSIPRNHSGK